MRRIFLDPYVLDTLLPDLVGHDRKPSAFLVYLYLLGQTSDGRRPHVAQSLQTIATRTGLSKSAVQSAIRHLKRRGLLDPSVQATVTHPCQKVMKPWEQ